MVPRYRVTFVVDVWARDEQAAETRARECVEGFGEGAEEYGNTKIEKLEEKKLSDEC